MPLNMKYVAVSTTSHRITGFGGAGILRSLGPLYPTLQLLYLGLDLPIACTALRPSRNDIVVQFSGALLGQFVALFPLACFLCLGFSNL